MMILKKYLAVFIIVLIFMLGIHIGSAAQEQQEYENTNIVKEGDIYKVTQKDDETYRGVDRTQSLVLSVMPPNPCIPGIIDGINRYRQIGCEYVLCLQRTAYGMPVDACESAKGYNLCKYVVGEAFYLVPLASTISDLAQTIKQALSSPAAMFGMALNFFCQSQCTSGPGSSLCYVCVAADTANFLAETACDLGFPEDSCTPIWEKIGGNKYGDICSQIKDEEETNSTTTAPDTGGDGL